MVFNVHYLSHAHQILFGLKTRSFVTDRSFEFGTTKKKENPLSEEMLAGEQASLQLMAFYFDCRCFVFITYVRDIKPNQ